MRYTYSYSLLFFLLLLSLTPNVEAEVVNSGNKAKPAIRRNTRNGVQTPRRVGKNTQGRRVMDAPVYSPFVKAAERFCSCQPLGVGTWGSRGNNSCHPVGRAIDVRGANCGGKTSYAVSAGFTKFVTCMQAKGWFKMYNGECVKGVPKTKTTCHRDHGHFSKCCTTKSGGRAC